MSLKRIVSELLVQKTVAVMGSATASASSSSASTMRCLASLSSSSSSTLWTARRFNSTTTPPTASLNTTVDGENKNSNAKAEADPKASSSASTSTTTDEKATSANNATTATAKEGNDNSNKQEENKENSAAATTSNNKEDKKDSDGKTLKPNVFGKIDPNDGPLKVTDDGEFEPLRWIQTPYQDPALAPIVDEKGEYIVSKGDWPTGELAYRPLPRSELGPRFGYNIVSVKKPQTYWQYWRKNEHFNVTYVGIQAVFIVGMAYLMGKLYEEIRHIEQEGKTAGNHAGEVRGKGRTDRKKQKIAFTPEEQEALVGNAQESYITGKEATYLGNRDYKMKKISRPEEYDYTDFRKR